MCDKPSIGNPSHRDKPMTLTATPTKAINQAVKDIGSSGKATRDYGWRKLIGFCTIYGTDAVEQAIRSTGAVDVFVATIMDGIAEC